MNKNLVVPNFVTKGMSVNNILMYKIAKFLVTILFHLTINQYIVKILYDFSENIIRIKYFGIYIMSSLDTVSLFTKIPHEETLYMWEN